MKISRFQEGEILNARATPEQLKTWFAALRSGDYAQTKGTLKSKDAEGNVSFCCLGVAMDCLTNIKVAPSENLPKNKKAGADNHYHKLGQLLSDSICDEGISMNDSKKSFEDIAEELERMYIEAGVLTKS